MKIITIEDALKKVEDGMTIMVGGFLTNGGANKIMDALVLSGVKDLTIICNDSTYPDKGMGQLITNRQVKKLIASYVGSHPVAIDQMNAGELVIEFSPQGTLAERVRAAGAGLGGILTSTGVGTVVEEGKDIIVVDGVKYLLEKPLKADVAIIGASLADKAGNLYYKGTTRNFNTMMAMAADTVIAEVEEMVEIGAIKPEEVHTPAILVDYVVMK